MIGPVFRHIGVLISLGILGIMAVVLTIIAMMMARSGASLRPIIWSAGLVLLVVGPQLVAHTYDAIRVARLDAPHAPALDAAPGRRVADPEPARCNSCSWTTRRSAGSHASTTSRPRD